MEMGVRVSASPAQKQLQTLSPQMRQSLGMLAMNLPELRTELYREMARNPVIDDIEQTLERRTESDQERESEAEERSFDSDYTEDDDIRSLRTLRTQTP